jgi:hypothetical protein
MTEEARSLHVTCDNGCGRRLAIPTTKEASAGWRRLSLRHDDRLYFAYCCPECPEDRVKELLERKRR